MSSPLPLFNDLLACLLGYLIGAIPFGYLVFYAAKGIDIRTVGSGNIGATNVGRNLGFRYFLLVFALDVLKGFVPTAGLPLGLKRLGMSGVWAAPGCVAQLISFRAAERRLHQTNAVELWAGMQRRD